MNMQDIYRARENLVTREIVGETIVVPISGKLADLGEVFTLNPTGAFIWQQLDGMTTLETICRQLSEEFEVDLPTSIEDVTELVTELSAATLIERVVTND